MRMRIGVKKLFAGFVLISACILLVLFVATRVSMVDPGPSFSNYHTMVQKPTFVDRSGVALNITFSNDWNLHDTIPIHAIPEFLQSAFLLSEDKRFYQHSGIDWWARANALRTNIIHGEVVRGASTITEQVIRMLNPRPRTVWSRWLEGFEAQHLERRFSKLDVLEFYLNQIPYAANRRGIKEAASYYFDRDLDTLNQQEMLALAVIVRSPKWFDPQQYPRRLNAAIIRLADRMRLAGQLDDRQLAHIKRADLTVKHPHYAFYSGHFIQHLESTLANRSDSHDALHIHTTLDAEVQQTTQHILDTRLDDLHAFNVNNGAVLVVDHEANEVLAWVVGYEGRQNKPFNKIDPVLVPRQPGSTLKPFVYAKAIELGWTAATRIDDSPLGQSVGRGMHIYSNYSRSYYGSISVREALGNSLNIPAVKAVQFVTAPTFLDFMYSLGVHSFSGHPNVYGDGIALGNAEMTLYELVQAYAALARMGDFKPLSALAGQAGSTPSGRVVSEDIASLIADILSDPAAREKEFGWDSILNFPVQTAVKTGTSSDYRDAWALGFNDKYTVGVWMGNMDYSAMHEVTGSSGPAVVLRSVFNNLNYGRQHRALYFSSHLEKRQVCVSTGLLADGDCETRDEWFVPGHYPRSYDSGISDTHFRKPSNGLQMAMDPRIPDESEYFEFELASDRPIHQVEWFVDDIRVAVTDNSRFLWKLERGEHIARAKVWRTGDEQPTETRNITYTVF